MSNIIDFLFSHIPWLFSTIIVLAIGITGLKVERVNNFNHEAEQVIARYGGLTPKVEQILSRDSDNTMNNTNENKAVHDFNTHDYMSQTPFKVTTLEYDKNGKIIPGATTSDFNGNGSQADQRFNHNASYEENKDGHFVKINGYYHLADPQDMNTKYKGKTRYDYGYYQEDPNGNTVNVNGSYVPISSDKLTAEQKQGKRYKWVSQLSKDGINFVQDNKGHYIHFTEDGMDDYVWMSTHDLKTKYQGRTRYGFKGNYDIDKRTGYYKNNNTTDHFVTTIYETDDMGRVLYDAKGNKVVSQQIPNQTTNYGGKITYVIWVNFKFFHFFNVTVPTIHTVRSQVRQGSIGND